MIRPPAAIVVVRLACVLALAMVGHGPAVARSKDATFAATLPPDPPARVPDGAIFNVSAGYSALVEGRRAHGVGDPVVIDLVENISTSKQAIGKTTRSGSANVVPPTAGLLSFLNPNALNASGGSSFSGEGDASQNSNLAGSVSVTIAQVRANGTALVKGQKQLTLSQGKEWVQLSGIVRLSDIDTENHVQSTQVADAKIEYSGNGSIGRASREGWLEKFFNMISPF